MRSSKWVIVTVLLLAVCKLATAQTSNTGNVGIGTTSPTAKLQINHQSAPTRPTFVMLDSAGGRGATLQFRRLGLDSAFSITGVPDGSESRRGLIMGWRDDSLLWLKPNGALGLGTNMPMARMQVNHKSSKTVPTFSILDSAGGAGSTIQFRRLGLESAFSITGVPDGNESRRGLIMSWIDDSLLWLKPNGALGLGTNMPMARMQVNHKSSKTVPTFSILDSAGGAGGTIQFRRLGLESAFSITGVPDGSDSRRGLIMSWIDDSLLWLKPNGRLGLGTNMPMARMQVNHKSRLDLPSLAILDSAGGSGPALDFMDYTDDSYLSYFRMGVSPGSTPESRLFGLSTVSRKGNAQTQNAQYELKNIFVTSFLGSVGIGTTTLPGKFNIGHKSTPASPSVLVLDSSGGDGPTIEFAKMGLDSAFTIKAFSGSPLEPPSLSFGFRRKSGSIIMLDQDCQTIVPQGFVGFGTSNPLAKIQINHKSSNGTPSILLLDSAGGAGSTISLGSQASNSRINLTGLAGSAPENSMFRVGVRVATGDINNDGSDFFFMGNGRLGLGVANPVGRLQLNHRSTIGNPALLLLDSAQGSGNMISLRKEGVNRSFNIGTTISEGGANSLSFLHTDAGGANAFLHYNANNNRVGINTLNPQATLDVGGSLRIIGVLIAGVSAGQPGNVLTSMGPNEPAKWESLEDILNSGRDPDTVQFHVYETASEQVGSGTTGSVISIGGLERFDITDKFTANNGLYACNTAVYQFQARASFAANTLDGPPFQVKITIEFLDNDNVTLLRTAEETLFVPSGAPAGTQFTISVSSLQSMGFGQKARVRFTHNRGTNLPVKLEEFSGFNM